MPRRSAFIFLVCVFSLMGCTPYGCDHNWTVSCYPSLIANLGWKWSATFRKVSQVASAKYTWREMFFPKLRFMRV
jgi:hypothetical protein